MELLAIVVPILLVIIIGAASRSAIMGAGAGVLALTYIAMNTQNNLAMGAFILVITFMALASAVYMSSMVLGGGETSDV